MIGDVSHKAGIRRFNLQRNEDESGISGTGVVAEGVEFSNGRCVISWKTKHSSIAIYDSIFQLDAIHSHGGKTIVVWLDNV